MQAADCDPGPTRLLQEATRHLERAVELAPRSARYAALLGETYLVRGEPEEAVAPLALSYQEDPHPRAAYAVALSLLVCGRPEEAQSWATAALEESQALVRAREVRGWARAACGDAQRAAWDLRAVLGVGAGGTLKEAASWCHAVSPVLPADLETLIATRTRELLAGFKESLEAVVSYQVRDRWAATRKEPGA